MYKSLIFKYGYDKTWKKNTESNELEWVNLNSGELNAHDKLKKINSPK